MRLKSTLELKTNCNSYSFQIPCTNERKVANYIQLMPFSISVICSSRDNSQEVFTNMHFWLAVKHFDVVYLHSLEETVPSICLLPQTFEVGNQINSVSICG